MLPPHGEKCTPRKCKERTFGVLVLDVRRETNLAISVRMEVSTRYGHFQSWSYFLS